MKKHKLDCFHIQFETNSGACDCGFNEANKTNETREHSDHTPTPWYREKSMIYARADDGEGNLTIAHILPALDEAIEKADGDFIVRAVNSFEEREAEIKRLKDSHEALMVAAKEAKELLRELLKASGHEFVANAFYHLDSAVAKAEGK